jgi:hypothetical protein
MPWKNHESQQIEFHGDITLPLGRVLTSPGASLGFMKNGLDQAKRDFVKGLFFFDTPMYLSYASSCRRGCFLLQLPGRQGRGVGGDP